MRVSAVIPTYNYARFVGRAIDSVLAQTTPVAECIVVDDGSTDNTGEILAGYGDRIRAIRQENRGLSAARNAGLRAATGDCLALLDADDLWKPTKIARQLAVLGDNPDISVLGCGVEVLDLEGNKLREIVNPSPGVGRTALLGLAVRASWVSGSGSGALIRRRVFDDVGLFDETLNAAEDWDMWMRIAVGHRIYNVPEVLATIYRHGTGSFRNAARMETNQLKVYDAAVRRWPHLIDAATRRRMRARIAVDAGIELAHAGQHAPAVGRYLRALRAWPLTGQTWKFAARGLLKIVGI